MLLGTVNESWLKLPDLKGFEILTLVPLAVLMILIGIFPNWILDTINNASVAIMKMIGA